jgi:hypothetical protein
MFVILAGLAFGCCLSSPLFIISDVHLDPYYGTPSAYSSCNSSGAAPPYSRKSCDSSVALVQSALEDVASQSAVADSVLILFLGDVPRHNMDIFENLDASTSSEKYAPDYDLIYNITKAVFGTLISDLSAKRLGGSASMMYHPNVATVLGNEDCTPDFHFINSNEPSLHPGLLRHAEALVDTGILTPLEGAAFERCGFYSRIINDTNLEIVCLNTVLYSSRQLPVNQSQADPCGQFEWLRGLLSAARLNDRNVSRRRVMVTGHIVPFPTLWVDRHLQTFRAIVMEYSDVISAMWFAHTHFFSFQTLTSDDRAPLLFDLPGITPRDGNVPSYVRVNFVTEDADTNLWTVANITERYYNNAAHPFRPLWESGKSFPVDFPSFSLPLSTAHLFEFADSLLAMSTGNEEWLQFEAFHFGGATLEHLSSHEKTELLCNMLTANISAFSKCVGGTARL